MRSRLAGSLLLTLGLMLLGGAFAVGVNAGGGCHGQSEIEPTDSSATEVRISDCMFGPTVNRVPAGATVRFTNTDEVPHNVIGYTWGTASDLERGGTFSHTFANQGIFAYACTLHPGMTGAIVVGAEEPVLTSTTTPAAASAPAGDGGSPVGMVLAGAGGLVLGAIGAGLVTRRRPTVD